jgi:hypothetical protein
MVGAFVETPPPLSVILKRMARQKRRFMLSQMDAHFAVPAAHHHMAE